MTSNTKNYTDPDPYGYKKLIPNFRFHEYTEYKPSVIDITKYTTESRPPPPSPTQPEITPENVKLPKDLIDLINSYNNSTNTTEKTALETKIVEKFKNISIHRNGNYLIISGLSNTDETDIHIPEFNPSTVIESIIAINDPRIGSEQKEIIKSILTICFTIENGYIVEDGKINNTLLKSFIEIIKDLNIDKNILKTSQQKRVPINTNKKERVPFNTNKKGGVKTHKKIKKQTRRKIKKQTRRKFKMRKYHGGIPFKAFLAGCGVTAGLFTVCGYLAYAVCDLYTFGLCTGGAILCGVAGAICFSNLGTYYVTEGIEFDD